MGADFTVDATELRDLGVELRRADVLPEVEKVVFKGAMNVKEGMTAEMSKSTHFKGTSPTIDFDIEVRPNGVEAEIGPDKDKGGALANIAYFGASRGGGGTVNLMRPFDAEKPRFIRAVREVLRDVL